MTLQSTDRMSLWGCGTTCTKCCPKFPQQASTKCLFPTSWQRVRLFAEKTSLQPTVIAMKVLNSLFERCRFIEAQILWYCTVLIGQSVQHSFFRMMKSFPCNCFHVRGERRLVDRVHRNFGAFQGPKHAGWPGLGCSVSLHLFFGDELFVICPQMHSSRYWNQCLTKVSYEKIWIWER